MVVIMNQWIAIDWTTLYEQLIGFFQKSRGRLPCLVNTPCQCSKFLLESKLLTYFCYCVCIIFVILCPLLCMAVFHIWSKLHSFVIRQDLGSLDYSQKAWQIKHVIEKTLKNVFLCYFCDEKKKINVYFSDFLERKTFFRRIENLTYKQKVSILFERSNVNFAKNSDDIAAF